MFEQLGPDIAARVEALMAEPEEGKRGLPAKDAALVRVALSSSPTLLWEPGMKRDIEAALDVGATRDELVETVLIAMILGMHTFTDALPILRDALAARGEDILAEPMDEESSALWRKRVGDGKYWEAFEASFPKFLETLLRLSPEGFEAFFEVSSLPWKSGQLSARLKELMYIAIDASTTHLHHEGLRFHIQNALSIGATKEEIAEVILLAAEQGRNSIEMGLAALTELLPDNPA